MDYVNKEENFVIIDDIYWDRVQLYIKGNSKLLKLVEGEFTLNNFNGTKKIKANDIKIDEEKFICRFNISFIDKDSFLSPDEYNFVIRQGHDYIAKFSEKFIENYNINNKKNSSIQSKSKSIKFKKVFMRDGDFEKDKYTLMPVVSKKGKEFILKVEYSSDIKKEGKFSVVNKSVQSIFKDFLFYIRESIFKSIFNITKLFHIRKGNYILFTSESRSDMSGNFRFIYNEMLRMNLQKKYKIHGIFKAHILDRYNIIDKFKLPYLLGKADFIFIDDFHPTINKLKFRKSQEIVQLWHAVGAFKTFGYSRIGKQGGPFFDSKGHRKYTKAYVSSSSDVPIYAEAFGITEDKVIPTGVPRTDALFDEDYKKKVITEMRDEIPITKGKKVVLFAPTFRGHGHKTAYYPFSKIDFNKLAEYCHNHNAIVLVKLHPFIKDKINIPYKFSEYIIDISNIREVNDVLLITDILITDYSSLIFEYAILERPMIFFAYDLKDYVTTREFYKDYDSFIPGKKVETFDQLIAALYKEDFEQEKVHKFLQNHFEYRDGQSSNRIINNLFI